MRKTYFIALYRLLFAVLALVAVVAQFINSNHRPGFLASNFFSFFTIESNIFAAIIFIVSALAIWQGKRPAWLDMLRGAATVYMVTTGIVYMTLLSGLEASLETVTPWINFVVHQLFPVVVIADWLIDRSRVTISLKKASVWLAFPLLYGIYTLVRGHFVDWYPYPFLNPILHSYGHVAGMCVVVGLAIYVICIVVARITPRAALPSVKHKKAPLRKKTA